MAFLKNLIEITIQTQKIRSIAGKFFLFLRIDIRIHIGGLFFYIVFFYK